MIYQIDVRIDDVVYSLKDGMWEGDDESTVEMLNTLVTKEDVNSFIQGSISDYDYAIAYLIAQHFNGEIINVYYDSESEDDDENLDYDEIAF